MPDRHPRERQIEFPPLQAHSRAFELGLLLFNVICVVIVIIIVLTYEGAFIGPW